MKQKMNRNRKEFIPALSYRWLTPAYDLIMRFTMREFTFKGRLVKEARIGNGHRVLDLGCGSATLTILVKQAHPETEVIGLDSDPRILRIARTKVLKAGLDIMLDYGTAIELPYSDASFDRVLSSLLFHHLTRGNKERTLGEIFRILRSGGELYMADLGKPNNILMYLISLITRQLEETSDNMKGLLPKMIKTAGFVQVEELARYMTIFGTLYLYRARKPAKGAVSSSS